MIPQGHPWNTKTRSVIWALFLSAALILFACFIATKAGLTGYALSTALLAIACVQAFVQLALFFHLFSEGKPHWNLAMFGFFLVIVVVIVAGSIWIMYNLDYNVM